MKASSTACEPGRRRQAMEHSPADGEGEIAVLLGEPRTSPPLNGVGPWAGINRVDLTPLVPRSPTESLCRRYADG